MKYYIIAGEASGDLHGASLMKALRQKDAQAEFRIWGGDLMAEVGGTLVKHYRDLAFMGFVEVMKNIRTILSNIKFCKEDISSYQPDALILIDYPGFNLRIAQWAKKANLRVLYYISPQIWAWHSSRVHKIKKTVDRMFVILPFEKEFYQKYDYQVDFVGHPLLDVVDRYKEEGGFHRLNQLDEKPVIALLPGSRKQEIDRMLQVMLTVPDRFPDYQFVIAGAPSIPESYYLSVLQQNNVQNVALVNNQTYALLSTAKAALVTSGTATLETALFGVPQVVCYRGNPFSYFLAKRLINVKFIALVNLVLDRPLVKELIQEELNTVNLQSELASILDGPRREQIEQGYQTLYQALGQSGAAQRTAEHIFLHLT